jgi:hypothetical protein
LTPHDRLFKLVFRNPEHAGAELCHLLPRAIGRQLDWSTTQLCDGSDVDAELREFHADLVFAVQLRRRAEQVYFVIEHKSAPYLRSPTQLLGYVYRFLEGLGGRHPDRLPQVVCVVVHHSGDPWRGGTGLLDATDVVEGLFPDPARYLTNVPFLVDDLWQATAEELRHREMPVLGRLALFCLKRGRHAHDLLAELRAWIGELRQVTRVARPDAALFGLFRYIMEVTDTTHQRLLEFLRVEVGPAAEKLMKSTYDQIIEEGTTQGMANLLLRQLAKRFGSVAEDVAHRVRQSSVEELGTWAERVLTAASLEQVFEDV